MGIQLTCSVWSVKARIIAGTFLLGLGLSAQAADIVVVVEAKSPVGAMTREEVADIYLGRTRILPGGGSAELIDQAESTAIRTEFYPMVTGKTAARAKALWVKQAFTGKADPPRVAANSAEAKKMLAGNPKALAYIEKSAVDASVKVIYSAQPGNSHTAQ